MSMDVAVIAVPVVVVLAAMALAVAVGAGSSSRWTHKVSILRYAGSRTFECVYITLQRASPLPLTLGASRTSRGLPVLAGGGR